MRNAFIQTLMDCAAKDERICLITADIGYSVVEGFAARFPKRFLNVGIAEQNAIGVAAGMAMSGKTVFVYTIIPFVTMRCFEQIRVQLAYQKANVKLVGVGAGLSYGPAGATHHSIEDIAIMRSLPNMTVLCPGDPLEAQQLTEQSALFNGPVYIRLGKNGEPKIHDPKTRIKIGQAISLKEGRDLAILTTSNMLDVGMDVARILSDQKIEATVVSMPTIKPFDVKTVERLIEKQVPIYTLEEHSRIGGLGSAVAEIIAESNLKVRLVRLGLPDEYCHKVGSQSFLRKHYGLDAESIAQKVLSSFKGAGSSTTTLSY